MQEMGPRKTRIHEIRSFAEMNGIKVVILDLTDDETTKKAEEISRKMDILDIFNENMDATGYALLIDRESNEAPIRIGSGSANLYYLDSLFSDNPTAAYERNIKIIKQFLKIK